MPLQAYFRINAENMGQFERTLIIADEGSEVHYIEGCSAPVYSTDSLHSAVVEIVVPELVVGKIAVMAELLLKQVPMTRVALVVVGEALHLRVKVVTATADMGERRAELSP